MFEEYVANMYTATPSKRREIVQRISGTYGCSVDTVYRHLKKAGWKSGRKKRNDSRCTSVDASALEALAALLRSGVRKNGKHVMEIPTARQILESEGYMFGVSNARLATLLRNQSLDIRAQKAPGPHVRLRSLHPNHVHLVDPSLCLIYYLPRGGQRVIEDDEAYKNKPFLKGKSHLKVWRYVLTDHYSCSVCVKYYQAPGESMETLWDFLLYAWGPKSKPNYLFHGVPRVLYMDKGSANLGGGVKNGLSALRIQQITHTPGNPRAKGQVEKMNHLVEKLFESRLRTEPAGSIDQLNCWAEEWCANYNAGTLEGYDSILHRAGRYRRDIWNDIQPEELRELPAESKDLLLANPVSRRVGGDLRVSYRHPKMGQSASYAVGGFEGIHPGMDVTVQPILMGDEGTILIKWLYRDEEFSSEVDPLPTYQGVGFDVDAPVIGENFKRHPDTVVDTASKRLDAQIGDQERPFSEFNNGLGIRSISNMKSTNAQTHYLPREGKSIELNSAPRLMINPIQAAMRVRRQLGHWNIAWLEEIREMYPNGIPESEVSNLVEHFRGGAYESTGSAG